MGKAHARRYPRLSVNMAVDYAVEGESFRGVAVTLGGGGLLINGTAGLAPGKVVSLRIRPAKRRPVITVKGVVLYILEGKAAAVEFTEISTDDRNALLRFILQKTGDRRSFASAPLATQVECDRCMTLAFSRDVSLAGMFIETELPLPVGSSLKVRFNLDQKDRVVTASARVAYQLEKMGMGILFHDINLSDRDAIREYVENACSPPHEASATNS